MTTLVLILVAIILIAILYVRRVIRRLKRWKFDVGRTWAQVDSVMRQRQEEVPQLVELCQAQMRMERDLFDRILQARAMVAAALKQADVKLLGPRETQLKRQFAELRAQLANYPQVRMNADVVKQLGRLGALEAQLTKCREAFNAAVASSNAGIRKAPYSRLARFFGLTEFELLTVENGSPQRQ
jgi:LemA protein